MFELQITFAQNPALSLQEILSKTIPGYPLESLASREAFIFYPIPKGSLTAIYLLLFNYSLTSLYAVS